MIILVTGGARSGKSRYAQELALSLTEAPIYVATAKKWGGDFDDRIRRHQNDRSEAWTTIEVEEAVSAAPIANRVAVIDCITLWLTNFFLKYKNDIDKSLESFKAEIDNLHAMSGTFIIVTNEIGMGVHAETEIGRKFTDLQGWANQYTAAKAGKAVFMVSGLPLTLK
jgi:adenosylcobinamide kinase / adenosylcobinamide-phosphate guanylyltransferase